MPACFIREDSLFYFCLLKEVFSEVGKKSGVVKAVPFLGGGGGGGGGKFSTWHYLPLHWPLAEL